VFKDFISCEFYFESMGINSLRERLYNGEAVIGTFQIIESVMVAEMTGIAGFDFTILDQEHGPLTAQTSLPLCMATECGGASPIIRVRSNSPGEIQRALDIGASGVEIPHIETEADARAAASAARFAPQGERGLSPYLRAGEYTGGDQYMKTQNEERTVIIHIEGQEGIENFSDILSVEGIDVIFIGPYDLSQSLGIPGQVHDDQMVNTMEDLCDRAKEAGKIVGTYVDDPRTAQQWIESGVQFIGVYVDAAILCEAFEEVVSTARD